jgi:hypothetical protein
MRLEVRRLAGWAAGAVLAAAMPAMALEMTVPLVQTGGFYADGGKNNSPTFQNYFVGYGTTPGFARTAERRSFFVFDVPALPSDLAITGAKLELRLPFGGLVFGKGPGDPLAGPVPDDPFESFALGLLPVPAAVVLGSTLTAAEVIALFGLIDDTPVAAPMVFAPGTPLPPAGDGGPPKVPMVLDGTALAALEAARGSSIVLGGWMPSWSEDLRLSPSPPPLYFEASEVIFGLTDVHAMAILAPTLTLTLSPVPEPPAAALGVLGLLALAAARHRHFGRQRADLVEADGRGRRARSRG